MMKEAIGMMLMMALMCVACLVMTFPFYVMIEGPEWLMWLCIPIFIIVVPLLYKAQALIIKHF